MSTVEPVTLDALPFRLAPEGAAGSRWTTDGSVLEIVSADHSDLFIDPTADADAGPDAGPPARPDVTRLVGEVAGTFQLSAKVSVGFRSTFDAGVLLAYVDDALWAKFCFERAPTGQGTVVSVITRGVSDDANAWDVVDDSVHLRISRLRHAFALHSSGDGRSWQLVRVFSLGIDIDRPVRVGFLAQAPTGPGCRAVFSDITFSTAELGNLRDGG
jgi:regulation of enolase protein 1 (concanavalin A-like superfamily)